MTPETALQTYFGHQKFRTGQDKIIQAVLDKKDILAILPTGAGKSLCFQLPAMMSEGTAVVISPLIALMRNQVQALKKQGIPAGALHSALDDNEEIQVLRDLREGRLKLLYLSPERFSQLGMMRILRQIRLSFFVLDEAHCANQWGHDFRPAYLELRKNLARFDVPIAAFTATADQLTRREIKEQFFSQKPLRTFLGKFDRPNLFLRFVEKQKPRQQILDFADQHRGQAGIVYCATRARAETLANALAENKHEARAYHAGLTSADRQEIEAKFQNSPSMIISATIAFGMGIDKPDIRWVAHADMPKNLESYYQEIGRAGRDGEPADTLCLFGKNDATYRQDQIKESQLDLNRQDHDLARLDAMLDVALAQDCRRQPLLAYFGEESPACGHCDRCCDPPQIHTPNDIRPNQQGEDGTLLATLKATRLALANQKNIPPYFILGDWILEEIARKKPMTLDAFAQVDGIGPVRLKRYGADFLSVINPEFRAPHPQRAKMAGQSDAQLFDLIEAMCHNLERGIDGHLKPLSLNRSQLRRLAEIKPNSPEAVEKLIGAKKADRFGTSILEIILNFEA